MQQFIDSFNAATSGLWAFLNRFVNALTNNQLLFLLGALGLAILALIVLCLILWRRHREALVQIDRHVDAMLKTRRDAQNTVDRRMCELEQRANELMAQQSAREREALAGVREKERQLTEKLEEHGQLKAFYEKHKDQDQAKRLIAEAKLYADDVKTRADREYTEMILHARKEADGIRQASEGILGRAHDMLQHALDRSDAILQQAQRGPKDVADDEVQNRLSALIEEAMSDVSEPSPAGDFAPELISQKPADA